MRLIWIAPYLPYPILHGGKARVFNLLARLSTRHEVHFVAINDTHEDYPSLGPLATVCASITLLPHHTPTSVVSRVAEVLSPRPMAVSEFTSREGERAVCKLLAAHAFDAAVVEQVQAGEYLRPVARAGVPTLLVCHNVERRIWQGFARYAPTAKKRLRAELEARKMARYEPRALRRATARLAVSEDDRRLLERAAHVPCGLSPNGVDVDYFAFQPRQDRPPELSWRLIMTGSMSYAPNIDAAQYFLDSILPRLRQLHPAVEVRFVGSAPSPELLARQDAAGQVRFTGFVDDVRPYVAESDLFIAPLRHGGGTRLKLVEAMAQGIPVVTTTAGCEGLAVTAGDQLWIADTPEAFADGIARLMADEALRRSMAANARTLVERGYGWERIAVDLEGELRRIASRAGTPAV
jgi:glycosyltransferase involved in cell wall biosynthesis